MAFWNKKKDALPAPQAADPQPVDVPSADTQPADTQPAGTQTTAAASAAAAGGVFGRFKSALARTSRALNTDIRDLWKSQGELVDEEFLKKLYAVLIKSDMGGPMARQIRDRIGRDFRARKVRFEEVLEVISQEIRQSLTQGGTALHFAETGPTIILVVGVNGSGKTTSIAKLAYRFTQQGKRVLLGAGDTFRAAAVEQLTIWSQRIGCEIVTAKQGADPGTVAFQATQRAREEHFDVCILDTAGRLQTQSNLMQELEKVRRVIAKQIPEAPHEVLLVLDATAGQNALSQARGFSEAAGCTGIVLAKIDGSAKGGVIVPIRQQFDLPVKLVGLGEQLSDMAEFDAEMFARGLLAQPPG